MKCQKCQHDMMELEETHTFYNSETEMEVEEYWWCPNCDATPTRFAIYIQAKERWEE